MHEQLVIRARNKRNAMNIFAKDGSVVNAAHAMKYKTNEPRKRCTMPCLATNCFRNFALINFYASKTNLSILSPAISVNFSCKQMIAYSLQSHGLSKIITSFVSRMIKNYHTRDQASCRWSRPQVGKCGCMESERISRLTQLTQKSRVTDSIRHLLNSK